MYTITPKKRDSLTLTIPAPKRRAIFVSRLRNGSGVHEDRRRRNERSAIKVLLRGGAD